LCFQPPWTALRMTGLYTSKSSLRHSLPLDRVLRQRNHVGNAMPCSVIQLILSTAWHKIVQGECIRQNAPARPQRWPKEYSVVSSAIRPKNIATAHDTARYARPITPSGSPRTGNSTVLIAARRVTTRPRIKFDASLPPARSAPHHHSDGSARARQMRSRLAHQ
jgi:hypothetical protein